MFNQDLMYLQLVLDYVTKIKVDNHCKACLLCNNGICSYPCRSPYYIFKGMLSKFKDEEVEGENQNAEIY